MTESASDQVSKSKACKLCSVPSATGPATAVCPAWSGPGAMPRDPEASPPGSRPPGMDRPGVKTRFAAYGAVKTAPDSSAEAGAAEAATEAAEEAVSAGVEGTQTHCDRAADSVGSTGMILGPAGDTGGLNGAASRPVASTGEGPKPIPAACVGVGSCATSAGEVSVACSCLIGLCKCPGGLSNCPRDSTGGGPALYVATLGAV